MISDLSARINLQKTLAPAAYYLQRPLRLFKEYQRDNLQSDLIAGLTVAVILLPQAIAFALIAELPPQMGLYAAIMGAVVGALWGSSNQIHNGPTNAISLLVFGSLLSVAEPGSAEFIIAAGLMAVMVGVFQLGMGLMRLGMLVNFVSHSVIVGFATGAGVLIGLKQLSPLLGISFSSHTTWEVIVGLWENAQFTHLYTAVLGLGTMLVMFFIRRINPRLPAALIGMVAASLAVFIFRLDQQGVSVIGELPKSLPPLARLPLFDLDLISRLSTGALTVGAIGLVETTAISRSVAAQTGQRLDSNQEFVGQGMANIFMGLFSGYAGAGSFSRTAVNFKGGAKSPFSAIFSAIFVLAAMFLLAPLAVYLPRAALSGVLIVTAYGMVDRAEIGRIWRSHPGEAFIMGLTLVWTFVNIEFAVLIGLILSLVLYIMRTSAPRVHAVMPDDAFEHFETVRDKEECPQLAVIEVFGDLYFGAVNHVEEYILDHLDQNPAQRYLLLRMHHVNNCDFSGIHMLENVVRAYRDKGGDIFFGRPNRRVFDMMRTSQFTAHIGADQVVSDEVAIPRIFYKNLDPAICIYECPLRVFKECQNLPKRIDIANIPLESEIESQHIISIPPDKLWQQLQNKVNGNMTTETVEATRTPMPDIIDVREPREYRQGHIAQAVSVPLATVLSDDVTFHADRPIVLVCRSGRRSRRAAAMLQRQGCLNVRILEGGMIAWEAAGLLEAIGDDRWN